MRFQNGKKQGIYWARCGLPGTKPIINVAELGLGERAVTISDDCGGWILLYEVGFLKAKACFWGQSDWSTKEGGWSGAAASERARMAGDEGRSRKPRVTLERKDNLECNSRGDGGFIVGKAARGRDTRLGGTPRDLAATRCRRFMKTLSHCGL